MTKKDYLLKYQGYTIPSALEKLIEFSLEHAEFSQEFCFSIESDTDGYETYSTDATFIESFIHIGCSDGTGSEYAFWLDNDNDLTNAPIVIFGSEGGYHIIASDFNELVRLLTFDCEPMADWDEVYFYKSADDEVSENIQDFHGFVEHILDLELLTTNQQANEIIATAQNSYQDSFNDWFVQYYQK